MMNVAMLTRISIPSFGGGANGCYPVLRIRIRRGIYEANGIDKALKVRVTYGGNDRTGLD